MKKLLSVLLFFPLMVLGQTDTENYIKTTAYKVPTATVIATPTAAQAAVSVSYFDALGRPTQQIAAKQSASGNDIVTPFFYDSYGRQPYDYLPFPKTTSTMAFDTNAIANGQAYYTATYTPNGQIEQDDAFSEKVFEASPLNRVTEQGAPGADWKVNTILAAAHSVRFEYLANNATADAVKLFKITPAALNASGYYPAAITQTTYTDNQLYKNVVKDENWEEGTSGKNNTTEEYTDKEGHLVLKRTYNAGVAHDTYYIYDIFGNLSYVIPPLAGGTITQAALDGLCYQYRYDSRNRLVEKKLPGKQWEFIVYDLQDRVVATGPAFTPFGGTTTGWLITKYDGFSRPVYTAWYSGHAVSAATRVTLQGIYNGLTVSSEVKSSSQNLIDNVGVNYSNSVFPTINFNLLTVSYYDDYDFPNPPTIPTGVLTDGSQTVYYNNTDKKPKGLPTGSWVRVLTGLPTGERPTIPAQTTYILYDLKGRPIRNYTTNYLGGYTKVDSKLDFTGKVLYTETTHGRLATGTATFVKDTYTYTDQDRPLTHTHQIGTAGIPQLLSRNEYNEMGQLKSKRVGSTDITAATYFQKVDYSYNIRGWLKGINDYDGTLPADPKPDLFAFKINYGDNNRANTTYEVAVPSLYNGNISETFWKTANDNVKRKYGYQYDNLNRLSSATYQKPAVGSANSYSESMDYDKNGNIQHLTRTGEYDDQSYSLTTDNLTYSYNPTAPNQLMKVVDASLNPNGFSDGTNTSDDYAYDLNGNMTSDLNKGITVTYNHLNLPMKITFANASTIEYLYDATGTKLQRKVPGANTALGQVLSTEYFDSFQYADGVLNFFPTSEGYVKVTIASKKTTYNYVFNYTDHLGNVRLSYGADANGTVTIMEENNYYPFGLKHNNYNVTKLEYDENGGFFPTLSNDKSYKYKYNGKELQDELGLNVYDYGFRNYMPDIGRWCNLDSKMEAYYPISPYQYVLNNPVINVDVKGQWTVTRHYNITYNSLSAAGIGKAQANLLAHYAAVYADNPGSHINANNAAHPTNMKSYSPYVDYSGTANSQVTDYRGSGYNYNVWHSMRSPWEEENNTISASQATDRGMEFGWSKIFESAASGKLNSLKNNTDGLRAFGQGVHALQDAYAHHGRSDVGAGHLWHDRYGDTSGAERITDSAIIVHNLMSGNYEAFNGKEDIKFDVGHMSKDQMGQLINAIQGYLKQNRKK